MGPNSKPWKRQVNVCIPALVLLGSTVWEVVTSCSTARGAPCAASPSWCAGRIRPRPVKLSTGPQSQGVNCSLGSESSDLPVQQRRVKCQYEFILKTNKEKRPRALLVQAYSTVSLEKRLGGSAFCLPRLSAVKVSALFWSSPAHMGTLSLGTEASCGGLLAMSSIPVGWHLDLRSS